MNASLPGCAGEAPSRLECGTGLQNERKRTTQTEEHQPWRRSILAADTEHDCRRQATQNEDEGWSADLTDDPEKKPDTPKDHSKLRLSA